MVHLLTDHQPSLNHQFRRDLLATSDWLIRHQARGSCASVRRLHQKTAVARTMCCVELVNMGAACVVVCLCEQVLVARGALGPVRCLEGLFDSVVKCCCRKWVYQGISYFDSLFVVVPTGAQIGTLRYRLGFRAQSLTAGFSARRQQQSDRILRLRIRQGAVPVLEVEKTAKRMVLMTHSLAEGLCVLDRADAAVKYHSQIYFDFTISRGRNHS